MKYIYVLLLLFTIAILCFQTSILFTSEYLNSEGKKVSYFLNQLNAIKEDMHNGVAKDMQQLFPEGFVFSNVLYGLTAVELIRKTDDPLLKEKWKNEIKWAINEIESDYALSIFDKHLHPKFGAFYHSWKSWLKGKYLSILSHQDMDSVIFQEFSTDCEEIKNNYLVNNDPFPATYDNISWPGDVIVGVASLKLSDYHFNSDYSDFIKEWLSAVKLKLTTTNPLIPHSIYKSDPNKNERSRGSSQSLILRFLYEIDDNFAKDQYRLFTRKFLNSFFGYSLIRETPLNVPGFEDIDSGPVIFGYGSVANIVNIGTANFLNDNDLFSDLNIVTENLMGPIKYFYQDLIIADLFILWSRISQPIILNETEANSLEISNPKYIYLLVLFFFTGSFLYLAKLLFKGKKV